MANHLESFYRDHRVEVEPDRMERIVLEPLGERFIRIMSAANVAFRTPLIGRSLCGLFRQAGFRDIRVQLLGG